MYLEIIGEGCRLVEAVGRAGMLVRGSCNYHIVVRGGGRFLRKTKFPREKCATIFEILRKICTQPPMILAIRDATALLLTFAEKNKKSLDYQQG